MEMTSFNSASYKRTEQGNRFINDQTKRVQLSVRQRQFLLLLDKTDQMNQQICQRLGQSIDINQLIQLGLVSTAKKINDKLNNRKSLDIHDDVHTVTSTVHNAPSAIAEEIPAVIDDTTAFVDHTTRDFNDDITQEMDQIQVAMNLYTATEHTPSHKKSQHHQSTDTSEPAIIDDVHTTPNVTNVSAPVHAIQGITAASPSGMTDVNTTAHDARIDWVKNTLCQSLKDHCGLISAELQMNIQRAQSVAHVKRYIARWRTTLIDSKCNKNQIDEWLEQVKYVIAGIEYDESSAR